MNKENEPENGVSLIADAIKVAEEIVDPLDGLVERCTVDPGAPLSETCLSALRALRGTIVPPSRCYAFSSRRQAVVSPSLIMRFPRTAARLEEGTRHRLTS